jgi:hypothetical protein
LDVDAGDNAQFLNHVFCFLFDSENAGIDDVGREFASRFVREILSIPDEELLKLYEFGGDAYRRREWEILPEQNKVWEHEKELIDTLQFTPKSKTARAS